MDITHVHRGTLGAFVVEIEGKREAEMVYTMNDAHIMTIVHTEVSDKLNGKGAGKQLVSAGVDYARKNQIKIVPQCPFARAVFDKVPAFQDVLL